MEIRNERTYLHADGQTVQRGAIPTSRSMLAFASPFRPTATPPASGFIFPKTMSMWLNDQDGDCVTAEEAFSKACGGILIADSTVQTWATNNGVLNGADLDQVIQMMQEAGFSQDGNIYGDGQGLAVNYADAATMQAAIYQAGMMGGCVKMGVAADALPSGAGNTNGWFLTGVSPDSNEDHCMGVCGYGTAQQFCDAMNAAYGLSLTVPTGIDPNMQGYAVFTWSTIGWVDVQSWVNMSGEAWIRNPSTVVTGTGTPSPDSGLDEFLNADSAATASAAAAPPDADSESGPAPSPLCNRPIVAILEAILLFAASYSGSLPAWLQVAVADALATLQVICPTAAKKWAGHFKMIVSVGK